MAEIDRLAEPRCSRCSRWAALKFEEGYQARQSGKPRTDNPWPPTSEYGILWNAGWGEADADA